MRCLRCQHENDASAHACARCGASLGPVDLERVRAQLKRWQEHLLDLTKANPLLGINRSRVSKLRVTEPAPDALFADFTLPDDATLTLPRVTKRPSRTGGEPEVEAGEYLVEPGDLAFEGAPVDLNRRLRRIHDNARTTVEERGITTLHLSFGVLRWDDPMLGASVSPLWLVPCAIESRGPSAAPLLTRADEEAQLNPALALYLRERHGIELPDLPDDPTPVSLTAFLDATQAAVREVGWKVEPDVWLSTYSFESLVIYQDLKALADVAPGHEVIVALARAATPREGSEALGEESLDTLPTPDRVPVPVLPTDSSQLGALTTARGGCHLVVHGPPGTGKSQTIANLIADTLAQGKKVLFVSAKMAALDVVHDRLTQVGLGRFCLEAHSTKAGKVKIVEELRRTLEAARDACDPSDDNGLEDLLRVRDELNAYVRELHARREPLGLSIYQALSQLEKRRDAPEVRGALPWSDPLGVQRSELKAALEALGELAAQAEIFDRRATHPWRGLAVEPGAPPRRDVLEADLLATRDWLATLAPHLAAVASFWNAPEASDALTIAALRALAPALQDAAMLDRLPERWATRETSELVWTAGLLDTAATRARELAQARAEHDRALTVPPAEARSLLSLLEQEFRGRARVFSLSYWRWRAQVRSSLRPGPARGIAALRVHLARARRIQELEGWFADQAATLDAAAGGTAPMGPEAFTAAAGRFKVAAALRRALEARSLTPADTSPALTADLRRHADALAAALHSSLPSEALGRLDAAWPDGLADGARVSEALLGSLRARCDELLAAQPKLFEWIALAHALQRCRQLGLGPFVEALGTLSASDAPRALERRFYTAWVESVTGRSPALVAFSGARRNELIGRYRQLDAATRRAFLARTISASALPARRIAAAQGGAGEASEVGVLRREMEKQRRLKPLRKLFAEIPTVLQALKPCFLMSPLSVSTFLKPGALTFDVVVFDEASQLPTPQTVPAILRARQVVVAGDRNQLPPTAFFESSLIFDEDGADEELQPLESLLDDCVAVFPVFEQAHLRWHYRSRDERLIKFSNHYFYRDRPLITFPSVAANPQDQGVSLVHVPDGVWDRGGSRTNRPEARRAAEIIVDQLRRCPERSLGVVAMNVTQREAIEEEIEALLPSHPDLAPLLDPRRREAFFIKALENVQGDERDTMVISLGYAKSQAGTLAYNFGPLNMEGGWRRLNVLVTRARWHTILITSLRSHELAGVNPENRGAVALRNFIAYAEQGAALPAEPPAGPTDAETNDFEDGVAEALRERGFQVDQQVGASAYRIDVAVRDPRDPRRYLLGVECDGATYHSSRTARDRDLLRQEVLRGQGWRLYRVWSTEWFRDRESALARLLRAIQQAREAPYEDPMPAPPGPPAEPTAGAGRDPVSGPGTTEASKVPPVERRFPLGVPYRKYRGRGQRELLLARDRVGQLADQIVGVVDAEGPIHQEVLLERLKELNGVDRAGSNVQRNVERAVTVALSRGRLEKAGEFLRRPGAVLRTFRVPGDGVERALAEIAREEMALAILHKVEDQFGYQREALPRAIAELLGFDRLPAGGAEIGGSVVDDLVARGVLTVSGPNVYLA
jgi:very-short-patch-repair endonuclease